MLLEVLHLLAEHRRTDRRIVVRRILDLVVRDNRQAAHAKACVEAVAGGREPRGEKRLHQRVLDGFLHATLLLASVVPRVPSSLRYNVVKASTIRSNE